MLYIWFFTQLEYNLNLLMFKYIAIKYVEVIFNEISTVK